MTSPSDRARVLVQGGTEPKDGDNVPQWARLQHELRRIGLSVDPDGAVVVERPRVEDVLVAARERAEREREKRAKLQAGELSYDLDGLRDLVES